MTTTRKGLLAQMLLLLTTVYFAFIYVIARLGSYLVLNSNGRQFLKEPGRFVLDAHREADDQDLAHSPIETTSSVMQALGIHFNVLPVDKSELTDKTLEDLISGSSDPSSRVVIFGGMHKMLMADDNGPFGWFVLSDRDINKFPYRKMLATHMLPKGFKSLDKILANRLSVKIEDMENAPINDLRKWAYQFTIEILCEHVLGLQDIPADAYVLLHKVEDTLEHKLQPFTLAGYDISLFPSQSEFSAVMYEFEQFTMDLLEKNQDQIINGEGFLHDILLTEAKALNLSVTEAFDEIAVNKRLGQAIKIVTINSGALHKVLTVALMCLDQDMLKKIQGLGDEREQKDYLECYFHETLRLASSVAHTARLASKERTLEKLDGETIPVKKNTLMFIDFQNSNHDAKMWNKPEKFIPERFQANDAPDIHKYSHRFAPFGLGQRQCPGRLIANRLVSATLASLAKANIHVDVENTKLKNPSDSTYWTTSETVNQPKPGVDIQVRFVNESNNLSDQYEGPSLRRLSH